MVDLSESREKIDAIDRQIVKLFEERMTIAGDVAEYKIKSGKPVLDRTREAEKLDTLEGLAHNGFNKDAIRELYEQIMSISRKYQYTLMNRIMEESSSIAGFSQVGSIDFTPNHSVFYFGVKGSHTQMAMQEIFGYEVEGHHKRSFRGVMEAIRDGFADYGVLPIENSTTGGVTANYDNILEYQNAIVGEHVMEINQCLIGLPGSHLDEIRAVYSHPQGLMQCQGFFEKFPGMSPVEYENTASAAKKIKNDGDPSQAAIASARAAEIYGLTILSPNIQTVQDNYTRFIIIGPDKIYSPKADKISLCIELPHVSGSLYRILSHFIFNDINMTLIESRPIPGKKWEYRFFVDIEGNLEDPAVRNALRGIQEESAYLRVLGNYVSR